MFVAVIFYMQEHEVDKMFPLRPGRLPANTVQNIVFITRPKLSLIELVAQNVLKSVAVNDAHFTLFFSDAFCVCILSNVMMWLDLLFYTVFFNFFPLVNYLLCKFLNSLLVLTYHCNLNTVSQTELLRHIELFCAVFAEKRRQEGTSERTSIYFLSQEKVCYVKRN